MSADEDEFAEFDIDEARFNEIMERAEPVELVAAPRAAQRRSVTLTVGYSTGRLSITSTSSDKPSNWSAGSAPVVLS